MAELALHRQRPSEAALANQGIKGAEILRANGQISHVFVFYSPSYDASARTRKQGPRSRALSRAICIRRYKRSTRKMMISGHIVATGSSLPTIGLRTLMGRGEGDCVSNRQRRMAHTQKPDSPGQFLGPEVCGLAGGSDDGDGVSELNFRAIASPSARAQPSVLGPHSTLRQWRRHRGIRPGCHTLIRARRTDP